ncbi:MAG: ferrous iron transport protein A [Anaerolineae bacterium]|nr:ferrous iron transport protein A [Anaerolineae bacterium]
MQTTLDQLPVGKTAIITELRAEGADRRRLLDLGILPGTHILAEFKSPLGDPTAYRVRGATVALRKKQACEIDIDFEEAKS